jgi:hypothetical protein
LFAAVEEREYAIACWPDERRVYEHEIEGFGESRRWSVLVWRLKTCCRLPLSSRGRGSPGGTLRPADANLLLSMARVNDELCDQPSCEVETPNMGEIWRKMMRIWAALRLKPLNHEVGLLK